MSSALDASIVGSFFVAGLAGSFHCIGMCGPLVGAYVGLAPAGSSSVAWLHVGRIWTYSLLGFFVGQFGGALLAASEIGGWQRSMGVFFGAAIVAGGLTLVAGRLPTRARTADVGCSLAQLRRISWLRALISSPGVLPRLFVGALLGLLPCGLVYAMLVASAALASPVHSAAAMLVFGLGTVPSLSLAVAGRRLLPAGLRANATSAVGALLVGAGLLVIARSAVFPRHHHAPAATTASFSR